MPFDRNLAPLWPLAGYKLGMASACVVRPPGPAYIRLYHFTSADYALADLSLGRIKVSRFSDSNDPFELMAFSFDDVARRLSLNTFKKNYDRTTGLLCFSANWSSPVLWSHYAARHRGICLGFDVRREKAQQVQYADTRLRRQAKKVHDVSNMDSALRDLLICTKFRHWEYEAEHRVEVPLKECIAEGKNYFYSFNSDLKLAEVVLGPLCETSVSTVRKLVGLNYPSATTFQARLAIKSFAIVPKESTIP